MIYSQSSSDSVEPAQFLHPNNFMLHRILNERKYNNSARESIEKPVNNPNKPPKFARNAVGPYSSFLSEVMNWPYLKKIVKLDLWYLKL